MGFGGFWVDLEISEGEDRNFGWDLFVVGYFRFLECLVLEKVYKYFSRYYLCYKRHHLEVQHSFFIGGVVLECVSAEDNNKYEKTNNNNNINKNITVIVVIIIDTIINDYSRY